MFKQSGMLPEWKQQQSKGKRFFHEWQCFLSCVRVHIWSHSNRCLGCTLGAYSLLNNSTSEIQLWFHICVAGICALPLNALQNKSNTFWWLLLSKITVHKWSMKSYMSLLNRLKNPTQQTFGNRLECKKEACEAALPIWHLI